MSKRKRRLRQHTRRNETTQPPADGAAVLLPRGEACPLCGGNTVADRPAVGPIIYLPTPTPPPTPHGRSFAEIEELILKVTVVILLVLTCSTLVIPKARSFFEECQKTLTGLNSHASLPPARNHEAFTPPTPNPTPGVQPPTMAGNEMTSNRSQRKEGKKRVLKRRRATRRGVCSTS